CIRLVPIFNHLNDEQMHLIAQSANEVQYVKNELLFRFGDKDDTLYIINNGRVRIYSLSESGREQNHTYVTLPMSKKDLATYLGTTPETISRKFSSLEERGLIKRHTQKCVEIFDLD
ncbi:Crp/Fnr family transcriptional regulator, partial [Leuconostoc mesenteroides]|uniref:Crp/Fnr family transcriptional regulator n=1 Tax=Leuconostoc mesenteroides TaxID=1245 RepID=UPI0021A91DB1